MSLEISNHGTQNWLIIYFYYVKNVINVSIKYKENEKYFKKCSHITFDLLVVLVDPTRNLNWY